MRITCPVCGSYGDLLLFMSCSDGSDFARLMGKVPPALESALAGYLNLFRPQKHKLTFARLVTILTELLPVLTACEVKRNRTVMAVTHEQIADAMRQMIERSGSLDLPLKSHGYLFEILLGAGKRAVRAAEVTAEATHDAGMRQQSARRGEATMQSLGGLLEGLGSGSPAARMPARAQRDKTLRERATDALAQEIKRRRASGEAVLSIATGNEWMNEWMSRHAERTA